VQGVWAAATAIAGPLAGGDFAADWPAALQPSVLAAIGEPTPFLATDLETVRRRCAEFLAAFDGRIRPHYAIKCNPSPAVLGALAGSGAGFEIASAAELDLALAAGAQAPATLFSNPVKPAAHIGYARALGVRHFAVDGLGELHKIARCAPGSAVMARLHVDDESSHFPLSSKFGAEPATVLQLLLEAADLGLVPSGLTFHVGSQCTDPRAWARAIRQCGELMAILAESGVQLELLDIGGGFPSALAGDRTAAGGRVPTLADIAAPTLAELDRLPVPVPEVVAEPGRTLVADASVLVSTVIGREVRGGRVWVYLDVGAYNGLMEAAQTGGRWPFPVRTAGPDDGTAPRMRCTLTGPTCDSSDTVLVDADMPETLAEGDRVYIGAAGAYSLSYTSQFNGFGAPREILTRR